MGTSTPHTGPTGGSWSTVRRNTTLYAKTGDSKYIKRALRAYAKDANSGGGGGGGGGGSNTIAATQRLGGFLSALASDGLDSALTRFNLGEHVGGDRWEVFEAIRSFLLEGFEDQHVEQAFYDVLDALYGDAPQSYEEIQEIGITAEEVEDFLELMIAQCIFNGVVHTLHESLARQDPASADENEDAFSDYIQTIVRLRLDGQQATDIDWMGATGRAIIRDARRDALSLLEDGQ